MADPSLSPLSRGCGRFVSSSRDSYSFDGRLEVCFTPQDYFIWRSHDSMLHLSKSGHLLSEARPTLPKTFSTRRGPLLLYSQALITVEAGCGSDTRKRRKHDLQESRQEVEEQLSTLKELTAAILNYRTNQPIFSRLGPPLLPSLHPSYDPDPHQTGSLPVFTTPEPSEPDLHGQLGSWWGSGPVPADRNTSQLEDQPKEGEVGYGSSERVRLDLFLQIPCTSRTPTPQREPGPWIYCVASTPEAPADPQIQEMTRFPGARKQCRHASCEGAKTVDSPGPETSANQNNSERSSNRSRHTGLLLPLADEQWGCDGSSRVRTDRQWLEGSSSKKHHAQVLPPIAESHSRAPCMRTRVQTEQDADDLTGLLQQPLVLPQLVPGWSKENGARAEKKQVQSLKSEGRGGEEGGRLLSGKGFMMSLDHEAGLLGSISSCKAPGRQSSSTLLQNQILTLKDPREAEEKGAVRGVLPLELRDLQSNRPMGCLIVGPDGEILRLSLYDRHQDTAESISREQALQVLSPEGEKLPWLVMLQPEHTDTEAEQEQQTPVEQSQLRQSTQELLDLHRCPDVSTPSSSSLESETRTHTQRPEVRRKSGKEEAQRNARMSPPKETVWRGEQGGGDAEAEEEEERLRGPGHIRRPFGSTATGQRSRNRSEAKTEEASDRKRRNVRTEGPEEASETKGGRDVKIKEQTRKGERSLMEKKSRDAQPIRSQKKETRTERDAAKTQDPADVSADVRKKTRDREGQEREERGDAVRRKQGSEERRRRGRGELAHKETVIDDSEEREEEQEEEQEEVKISLDTKDQSLIKSTRSLNPDPADSDRLHTSSDKLSSIQSVSSLRSVAAASNLRSSKRSAASSCERTGPCSTAALTSSHGRLSSCSTVMVQEEQLMLNPMKPEASRPAQRQTQEEQEVTAQRLAQRAERRRQEVERKRKEREEEERRQQEREQTEDRMKNELEEERRRRAEMIRFRREAEEEKRRKQDRDEQDRARQEQEQRERERRRREENKRQMERLQRMREEEERRRTAEAEHLQLEEERRKEEENRKLREMDERERTEYLQGKKQEEEERRRNQEEQKRREEEAALQAAEEAQLQAKQLNRQMALLQQHLAFKRGLVLETAGLKESQRISRPWIYSYFPFLKFLSPNPHKSVTKTSDL
ncbi:uncharacterized protein KIAA2012 homolog isoform X2 [Halichoeres trimaculatus]|uniref:uncharacterized protein KIAA2012 homolog isoform X2 n=1 Tax=Halichoeres trimaculatus TaxID=147232 RepID=UPI003D9DDDF4